MTDPAPAASDLERKIRAEIWLMDWRPRPVSTCRSCSSSSRAVVACRIKDHRDRARMGYLTAPASGIDVLRDAVGARLKRDRFTKTMLDELGVDLRDLSEFSEGFDCLSPAQLNALAKLLLAL